MTDGSPPPLSGRRAQALRNDERILAAAREVFVADPGAPIAAVAEHAQVGISALYRRYPTKEALLHQLSSDGLTSYIAAAEAALHDDGDPWDAFAEFMRRLVNADTHSLTQRLAGRFTPTEELNQAATKAQALNEELFERVSRTGVLRNGVVVDDLSFLLEQLAAVRVRDEQRTRQLRERYLTLQLDALRDRSSPALPGPPPTWHEIAERWG